MPSPSSSAKSGELDLRVLIVASTFPASDVDPVPSFVRDLVVAVHRSDPGISFTVLAPHDPRSGRAGTTEHEHYTEHRFRYFWPGRLQRLAGQGGIVPSLRSNRWLYLLVPPFLAAEYLAIARMSKRLDPHVVNAHWVIPQGVVAGLIRGRARRPIVLTVHGGDVFSFNNPIARWFKRFALRAAAAVVVNSSVTLAKTAEIDPTIAPRTIPMGVDLATFPVSSPRDQHLLRVLFVGRLSEEKGVLDLISALRMIAAHGVSFEARIVGSGPDEEQLRDAASDLGDRISFLGWVNRADIPQHYAWADVFVGPSITSTTGWVEALGVVFIEASAASLPIVTTDSGGMRDVVLDGVTGFIVPEKSPDRIAVALSALAGDGALRARLGAAARAHVTGTFTWDAIGTRYAEVYRSVSPR